MTKGEKAKALFLEGYNCAQSVFGAFCEDFGLDFETGMKLSSGFGGGIGRLREVCGAVSGMVMVLDMKCGYISPTDNEAKMLHYKRVQDITARFSAQNGSIICRELLGLSDKSSEPVPEVRTNEYYKKRPCKELVEIAANIVDAYIKEI